MYVCLPPSSSLYLCCTSFSPVELTAWRGGCRPVPLRSQQQRHRSFDPLNQREIPTIDPLSAVLFSRILVWLVRVPWHSKMGSPTIPFLSVIRAAMLRKYACTLVEPVGTVKRYSMCLMNFAWRFLHFLGCCLQHEIAQRRPQLQMALA